jgi:hypothetical protein
METLSATPIFMMMGLVVAWKVFDFVFEPAFAVLLALLHPGLAYR